MDIPEDCLEVIGENILEDDSSSIFEDTIPVRILTNITIYHRQTHALVSLAELLVSTSDYVVVGDVSPKPTLDDEDDEIKEELELGDPDEVQRIKLSNLLEFNLHHLDETGLDWCVWKHLPLGFFFLITCSK